MQKLKQLVKENLAKSAFDVIYWSDPNIHTYEQAIYHYGLATVSQKKQIQQRLLKKLSKNKDNKTVLAILLLVHFLMPYNCQVEVRGLGKGQRQTDGTDTKNGKHDGKVTVAENGFVMFYREFLGLEAKKYHLGCQFGRGSLEENIKYCQLAIQSILTVLKYDFLMIYCQKHLPHKQLLCLILPKILQQTIENINSTSKWVRTNMPNLFTISSPASFQLNQCYQKIVHISKQQTRISQLQQICKMCKKIEYYEFDKQLNYRIEKFMAAKESEKRQYLENRKSFKNIGNQEQRSLQEYHMGEPNMFQSCRKFQVQIGSQEEEDRLISQD